jgi:hypothetical protein
MVCSRCIDLFETVKGYLHVDDGSTSIQAHKLNRNAKEVVMVLPMLASTLGFVDAARNEKQMECVRTGREAGASKAVNKKTACWNSPSLPLDTQTVMDMDRTTEIFVPKALAEGYWGYPVTTFHSVHSIQDA